MRRRQQPGSSGKDGLLAKGEGLTFGLLHREPDGGARALDESHHVSVVHGGDVLPVDGQHFIVRVELLALVGRAIRDEPACVAVPDWSQGGRELKCSCTFVLTYWQCMKLK